MGQFSEGLFLGLPVCIIKNGQEKLCSLVLSRRAGGMGVVAFCPVLSSEKKTRDLTSNEARSKFSWTYFSLKFLRYEWLRCEFLICCVWSHLFRQNCFKAWLHPKGCGYEPPSFAWSHLQVTGKIRPQMRHIWDQAETHIRPEGKEKKRPIWDP